MAGLAVLHGHHRRETDSPVVSYIKIIMLRASYVSGEYQSLSASNKTSEANVCLFTQETYLKGELRQ